MSVSPRAHHHAEVGTIYSVDEANATAFLAEQAGGPATEGKIRLLDAEPTGLHQRTPLVVGSRTEVELLMEGLKA